MNRSLVGQLVGRGLPTRAAVLDGFARIEPPGGHPYVIPRPGSCVSGVVLDDVDATALAKLDAYEDEGHLYFRRPVVATVAEAPVPCETYVGNPSAHPPPAPGR